jgi:gamma-glutamylcyclotransferase (GGCT)/AIG2-like uncharacterized protein YtfP
MGKNNRAFKRQLKKEKQREKDLKNQNKKKMTKYRDLGKDKVIVAVYGYLRNKMANHKELGDNPIFLGNYYTLPEYTLFEKDGFPFLIPEGSTSVLIEVYEIEMNDFQNLEWFNNLEGNTIDTTNNMTLYVDKLINTPYGEAVIFFADENNTDLKKANHVVNGDWLDYSNTKMFTNTLFNMLKI